MLTVAVLTAKPDLPVHRELEAAGDACGVRVEILDALSVAAQDAPPRLWRAGEPLDAAGFGAVLPRVGNWRPDTVLAVLGVMRDVGVG